MKKSNLIRLALMLVTAVTLSGCLVALEDDGYRHGGYYERDRGYQRGHYERY